MLLLWQIQLVMWKRWSPATGNFYLNVTHPQGPSSRSSETMPVGLLKTASASTTVLPPLVNKGQSSSNIAGARLALRLQEGSQVREHCNYTSQGEEKLVFSIGPLQLFIKPLVIYKLKRRLFLVLAGFAQRAHQLSVYHWVTGLASAWPIHISCSQLIPPQQQQAVPSRCQLTSGTESCKHFCRVADGMFLLVYDQFLL